MKHHRTVWTLFAACWLMVLIGVGWLSHRAMEAEESERRARHAADLENRVRVALWRMDSLAVPLVALESTRPSLDITLNAGPVLAPELIKSYWRRDGNGHWSTRMSLTKPPSPAERSDANNIVQSDWWQSLPISESRQKGVEVESEQQLYAFNNYIHDAALGSNMNSNNVNLNDPLADSNSSNAALNLTTNQGINQLPFAGQGESQSRKQLKQQVFDVANFGQQAVQQQTPKPVRPVPKQLVTTPLMPVWIEDDLVLARRLRPKQPSQTEVEACVLNWPVWNDLLKQQVNDVLPNARLRRPDVTKDTDENRRLVTLPVVLEPDASSAMEFKLQMPNSLLVTWALLTISCLASAGLLGQTLALSDRRAAFVSAVTHELRTPLTTFRLYTELLSDGVVRDADQQHEYFVTLHRESNRLMHLVENVLAFARLEKGRPTSRTESVSVAALLERCLPRLRQRVSETRLQFEFEEPSGDVAKFLLQTNVTAVEQVLFNLIDNACKYAVDANDPRVVLRVSTKDRIVQFSVCDFGPGMSASATKMLFEPFGKSSAQAAESAPGVGLGLSLSRRIARDLGGDLKHFSNEPTGCRFELHLPIGH